jgi:hypothetical protein
MGFGHRQRNLLKQIESFIRKDVSSPTQLLLAMQRGAMRTIELAHRPEAQVPRKAVESSPA